MVDYQSECVVDSSILIDIHIGNIVSDFFKLPYTFHAPDAILAELHTIDTRKLIQCGLRQKSLESAHYQQVMQLVGKYRGPSVNNLIALLLAQRQKAMLLTNDVSLRKAANQERVQIHGTLWLLDKMVKSEIISCAKAAHALKCMCQQGSYLPRDECTKRLSDWNTTSD